MAPAFADCTVFYSTQLTPECFYRNLKCISSCADLYALFNNQDEQSFVSFHLPLSSYLQYTEKIRKAQRRRQHVVVQPVHTPQVAINTIKPPEMQAVPECHMWHVEAQVEPLSQSCPPPPCHDGAGERKQSRAV